jgi:anti-sigma regulatory factor (Ser/Thr protein kinase)
MITTILCPKNDISEFQQLARAFEEHGSGLLLSKQVIHNSTLALEEVFSNIFNHAYIDDRVYDITCQMHLKNEQFNFQVIDGGQPFNPLSILPPDIHIPIDNRCIGTDA